MKQSLKISAAMLTVLLALSACETMEGLGRDTNKLGNDVTGAAQKHDLDNDPSR